MPPAFDLGPWLEELAAARRGGATDVPCDGCTACCSSGQFVHIDADEVDTLAHVPAELLFAAPGSPAGEVLMGYDTDGRCPMLGADGCRIYDHRPRTCRTYDCRVFAAAAVIPDQPAVARAAARWTFRTADAGDRANLEGIRRAANHLASHPGAFPGGTDPGATGRALAALATAHLFAGPEVPTDDDVRRALDGQA